MDISTQCNKCIRVQVCFAFRKMAETIREIDNTTVIFPKGTKCGVDDFRESINFILAGNCIQYEAKKGEYL